MSTDPGVRKGLAFESVNTDASGRELAEGDRIAQRSRRSQRGIRIGDARGGYHGVFFRGWPVVLLCMVSFLSSACCAEPLATREGSSGDKALAAITGNPAAENQLPGNGLAGRLIHLPEDSGLRLGGLWLADTNGLLSGGAQPGKWSWNSALIIGANLDAEKLLNWKGASFGVQFLQFNGQNTNGQAGSVQGYNSLPGAKPLNRSELYQLWYRQTLFDDKIIFRIGKMLPTYDFNNVARPVPTQDQTLEIPAVTGLLYTPVFVNPTLLGAIGGYYNSVSGLTVTVVSDWREPRASTLSFVHKFAAARKASLVSVNYTGWKPMLHCSPERRATTRGHAGAVRQQTRRDARRRKVA
jgi:carbohydrate-selective porin OprB